MLLQGVRWYRNQAISYREMLAYKAQASGTLPFIAACSASHQKSISG